MNGKFLIIIDKLLFVIRFYRLLKSSIKCFHGYYLVLYEFSLFFSIHQSLIQALGPHETGRIRKERLENKKMNKYSPYRTSATSSNFFCKLLLILSFSQFSLCCRQSSSVSAEGGVGGGTKRRGNSPLALPADHLWEEESPRFGKVRRYCTDPDVSLDSVPMEGKHFLFHAKEN